MSTVGILAILIGAWFIRQVAVGRVKETRTDATDTLNAVLGNGDIKEIMSRRGSSVTPFGDATTGSSPAAGGGDVTTVNGLANTGSNTGAAVLREARRLGVAAKNRYVWGATGPSGYDCSGLVWRAMRNVGAYTGMRFNTVSFPTLAASRGFATRTTTPAVGDIVLWSGHMGIVSGKDKMYNAASSKSGIRESSISGHGGKPSYWRLKDSSKGSAGTYSQN